MPSAAAASSAKRDEEIDLQARVMVTEQSLSTLASSMDRFVNNQREENSRLYDAINKMGERTNEALNDVKGALGNHGKITGQNVLTFIGVLVSFAVAIGGFGNYFINQSANALRATMEQQREAGIALRIDHAALQRTVEEHRIQSIKSDTESFTERRALMDQVKKMQEGKEQEMREEISRLRQQVAKP